MGPVTKGMTCDQKLDIFTLAPPSLEKGQSAGNRGRPDAGKTEGKERREDGGRGLRWLDSISDSSGHEFKQTPEDGEEGQEAHVLVHGVTKSRT